MNVVNKKCPNCGANIEIKENVRIYKCEYCNTTLEKDKNEELAIQTRETALQIFKGVFAYMGMMQIVSAIIFIFAFLFIAFVAIMIFTRI